MDEAILTIIVAVLIQGLAAYILYMKREAIYDELSNYIKADIVDWLSLPENQEAISKFMDAMADNVMVRFKGMLGGLSSGVSRQLKAAERDLTAAGIDIASGIPGSGALALKYLDKYPVLQMVLPLLIKQMSSGQPSTSAGVPPAGEELGKI